jgi:hypothetical protein
LTEITVTLKDIQDDLKGVKDYEKKWSCKYGK